MTYYNEHDPKAAAWLRELIRAGLIPACDVDSRDIQEVQPHELIGYAQQHFFAGIGGWALALRLAGWPDSREVRTGSCPCQPFSEAGEMRGIEDPRHLWPSFRNLITFGDPTITFGEQVAGALGREWLAGVRADLEGLGYAVGAADLCAASVAAPQRRQRLYWMANPYGKRFAGRTKSNLGAERSGQQASRRCDALRCGAAARLDNPDGDGREQARCFPTDHPCQKAKSEKEADRPGDGGSSPWRNARPERGQDGLWRRVEPGIPPLVARLPGRVALLRGSGNAIVPELAAQFILSCLESLN